jgi:hypothetical protein
MLTEVLLTGTPDFVDSYLVPNFIDKGYNACSLEIHSSL